MATAHKIFSLEKSWKHLPYEDIIRWCQVSKENNKICQDNNTWKYLLERDYGMIYNGTNTKDIYLQCKHIVDYFSQYYPIITQYVVEFIRRYVPINTLSSLNIYLGKDATNGRTILSLDALSYLSQAIPFNKKDYWQFVNKLFPDYNDLVKRIRKNGCDEYLKIVTKPTLIHLYGQPTVIKYNYDLANRLQHDEDIEFICDYYWYMIEDYMKSLI